MESKTAYVPRIIISKARMDALDLEISKPDSKFKCVSDIVSVYEDIDRFTVIDYLMAINENFAQKDADEYFDLHHLMVQELFFKANKMEYSLKVMYLMHYHNACCVKTGRTKIVLDTTDFCRRKVEGNRKMDEFLKNK